MTKVKLFIQGSIIASTIGLIFSAMANAEHNYPLHSKVKKSATFVNYGVINPGQKIFITIPNKVKPGTRSICWSRDLSDGTIYLSIPDYGKVKLAPNKQAAVFSAPEKKEFGIEYQIHTSLMSKFGFKDNTIYTPAHLICKFTG